MHSDFSLKKAQKILNIRVFAKEPARVWFWSFDLPEDRNPMDL